MFSIGTLAKRTDTKVQTVRYYEEIGLMPKASRTAGGQRRYGEAELDRLAFIRQARQLGFGLDAIRELLDLSDNPDRSCAEVDRIAPEEGEEGYAASQEGLELFNKYFSHHEDMIWSSISEFAKTEGELVGNVGPDE